MCPARCSPLPGYHPCQVLPQHGRMLYRNLFYTGISRAKQLLVLVGSEEVRLTLTPTRAPILSRTLTNANPNLNADPNYNANPNLNPDPNPYPHPNCTLTLHPNQAIATAVDNSAMQRRDTMLTERVDDDEIAPPCVKHE